MSAVWTKVECDEVQNIGFQTIVENAIYKDGAGNYAFLVITPSDLPAEE